MEIISKIGEKIHWFISDGGWRVIIVFAIVAIMMAVVGYYGTHGFNLGWFLCLELPLYIFSGWTVYTIYKLIENNQNIFK